MVAKLPSVATSRRLDQLDLLEEMRLAGLDLLRLRVAVARRPALEDVRDVDVLAREADAREQLASSFPAAPTNGTPCLSSWKPGASPTNIRSAVGRARAEDDLRPRRGERAALAAGDHVAVGEQREVSRSCHRNRRNSRRRKMGCPEVPCAANDMLNCFATFALPQSGQVGSGSDIPTSSSKWDSQLMQTYS